MLSHYLLFGVSLRVFIKTGKHRSGEKECGQSTGPAGRTCMNRQSAEGIGH